jgi:elongation factor Ts
MAQFTMQQVKELRDRTQAGLNDCKGALQEAEGDMEKAVEIILKKGLAKSAKRAGAVASEGVVATRLTEDQRSGVIVEVNIQTDFASRNPEFVAFVDQVLSVAVQAPTGADLGAQPFPGTAGSVEDARQALVGKLGENITVRRWQRVAVEGAGRVFSYVHMGGKVAVLLGVTAPEGSLSSPALVEFAENTAMQAAAMSPLYLSKADVPEADKAKQSEIFDSQLAEEGKPEKVRPGIIQGKLAKWMKEICLLEQESVVNSDKTVEALRGDASKAVGGDVKLVGFVRYERGEGIQKKEEDFAAEVGKMAGG